MENYKEMYENLMKEHNKLKEMLDNLLKELFSLNIKYNIKLNENKAIDNNVNFII